MEIRDYNGKGIWSREQIEKRYLRYCKELRITPREISPAETAQGGVKWIYPVMDKIIAGIESGDAACRRIGVEFIEEDAKFPFGKILKSNAARALRRSELTEDEKSRVRERVISMVTAGIVPHEFKEYIKLLKKVGFGEFLPRIEADIDRSNEYVMKHYNSLTSK